MTKIKEFNNLDYLQAVRNDHLNPLIRRVENEIAPTVDRLDHEISEAIKDVILTESTKTLKFDKGAGGYKEINLTPIMPKFTGIGVQNQQGGGPSAGIKLVQFQDATVTVLPSGEGANVAFDWVEIFDHNQKWPEAVVGGAVSHLKSIIFAGDPAATTTDGNNVTLRIPKIKPMMATIPGKGGEYRNPQAIDSIELEGESDASYIENGKLIVNLNSGGGGGTITNQNFKGFFESLGDIVSLVKDPIDGKSYAFAKDSKLGGKYYTPYFYVSGTWTELKQDPALTYFATGSSLNQGVFSIKPDPSILIDSTGQLDLSGLKTPQDPKYFVGFYESLDELKAACPKPVTNQTHAYVKGPAGGWLNYRSEKQGTASLWKVVAPMGSFSFVDGGTSSYRQVFGIRKSDAWEVDAQGLLTLKGGGGAGGDGMQVGVSDYGGNLVTHDIKTMTYNKGKSLASFSGTDNSELTIEHPQRVINYNATWEDAHNTQDYTGNVFYDETSRTWMGWGLSKDGEVDKKWTRIAHPHMSEEVKSLDRRFPEKLKPISPDILDDSPSWAYTGVTYLEKGSVHLPEEIRDLCGGYITTSVQDVDAPGVTIPQCRLQSCIADQLDGGQYVRRFISTGSPGAQTSWSPWVRNSFAVADIRKHEKDPNAHKDIMKFYRVTSLQGNVWELANQEAEGVKGVIRGDNKSLLADSYGYMTEDLDYGTVPYDGTFIGKGVIEFSGYNGTATALGKWTVKVRVIKKGESTPRDLYEGYYTHFNDKERFPPLVFNNIRADLVLGDQIMIHVFFDNPVGLKNKQPNLYIAPVKSYIVLQDHHTIAGTEIAKSFRNLLGRVDFAGDVGVRVHHNDLDVSRNVRVYGVISNKTPTEMTIVPKP